MASRGKKGSAPGESTEGGRLTVQVGDARRPFMRGIMVHSLMARGVPFDAAYETAERVRERVRDRGVVPAEELAKLVAEMLGEGGGPAPVAPPPTAIAVTSATGRSEPFSKGILAQSMLAASLDATDAFQVAVEIEGELRRQLRTEVGRSELRRMVFETLVARFGTTTGERYLIWRRYQEPDRPVILLLGGTTGAGKTSVALEVARRLGIRRVLSTDSIRQVMRLTLSTDLMPAIHASSFEAHVGMSFEEDVEDPVVEGFLAQAAVVTVGVRAMIERAIKENTSLVLDGVALVPGLIDLDAYAAEAHVIPLVVGILDEEAFAGRFEARGGSQSHREPHRYLQHLDSILRIQNHFLELADRHSVPIVDNLAVESSVQLILRHVSETLRKKSEHSLEDLF